MMQKTVEPAVERWFDSQPVESVWTTAVTVFEIHFGLRLMAAGRRRNQLETAFLRAIGDVLGGRVMPFDEAAARAAASIAVARRQYGRSVEIRDVQIAGIAKARKAAIATRNIRHFEDLGIALVDPWTV